MFQTTNQIKTKIRGFDQGNLLPVRVKIPSNLVRLWRLNIMSSRFGGRKDLPQSKIYVYTCMCVCI